MQIEMAGCPILLQELPLRGHLETSHLRQQRNLDNRLAKVRYAPILLKKSRKSLLRSLGTEPLGTIFLVRHGS